ncbi:VOC family protein [Bifidobacterium callimiconis]|uniref:Glyoxalase n=1 Tax=Bifidobacterium callimiconis TaxID=2306973 RepID=A0A430FCZ8_9BIFI|nr:VOC family protein [Bifidobacterium callimiconis]MBT1176768.1 VOC family protein [Bifidobacterium callimiconis]RSX50668.1 glyoxalase [Bifidobacterium callimiconis]
MIDHLTIKVKDVGKEAAFYAAALAPLGYAKGVEFPGAVQFVSEDGSSVWVSQADGDVTPAHVAFTGDEAAIKAFHEAGLAAGGTDNGAPGPRPNYGPTYYAAFVHDPEGNNIEACTH